MQRATGRKKRKDSPEKTTLLLAKETKQKASKLAFDMGISMGRLFEILTEAKYKRTFAKEAK
jgi:hypothetical protein